MAQPRLTVVVMDKEHYQKAFNMRASASVNSLFKRYCSYLCPRCTKPSFINFTYEGSVMQLKTTIGSNGLRNGDIIQVCATYHYRDRCVQEDESIHPGANDLHYLPEPDIIDLPNYELPKRISIKVIDSFGMEMALTTMNNAHTNDIMEAFAKLARKDMRRIRFHFGDELLAYDGSLHALGLTDGDTIHVSYEALPGTVKAE